MKQIPKCGYEIIGHFILPENAWWVEYYQPLEKRINELRRKYSNNPEALKILNDEQREVDMYKKNPELFGAMFFIMQKR
ncbi:MAG: hypothetical protein ACUVXA_07480 [Candidatus Jordarchaeum sp.]|uniref:hypothetical protein n=1 Tax=Candidatus Jordarchaeum sp. TaxID=2823881 RepID=UPI004049AF93